jgi:hypothetical protein
MRSWHLGPGEKAGLSYSGNLRVENRRGMIAKAEVLEADGRAVSRCGADEAGGQRHRFALNAARQPRRQPEEVEAD